MSTPLSNCGADWSISIPLSQLVALQGLPVKMECLERENEQLRRELESLRAMHFQCLELLNDLRADVRSVRGKAS